MSLLDDLNDGINPDWDGTSPIVFVPSLPVDRILFFCQRRPGESDEEWRSRRALAYNIGTFGS